MKTHNKRHLPNLLLQTFPVLAILQFSVAFAYSAIQSPGSAGLPITENDWPWWRGVHRNGHAVTEQAPLTWSANQNIAWKTEIPGRGHSSPTVVGDRIFLATALEDEKTQWVLCFDRESGKNLWSREVHSGGWEGRIHKRNTQASSTIASDGERLFATFMYKAAIWVSALGFDGELLWQKRLGDFVSHWGYSSSPVIYDSLVIIAADHKGGGKITGLDRKTGKSVWVTPRPAIPTYASPIIYHLAGRDQLFLPGCDMIASYDPATGKSIWSAEGTTTEVIGSVVTDGDRVFASGGYPKSITSGFRADGSRELAWTNPTKVYAPSLITVDGYLYTMTDNGIAYCWNAESGKRMWRQKVGDTFSASPVLVNDRLYVCSEQGKTVVFKANPERFELLAENHLGDESWASPVICSNSVFLRVAHHSGDVRQEYLYCISEG